MLRHPLRFLVPAVLSAALLGAGLLSATARACPFCSAVSLTFSEEMNANDVSVIAELAQTPAKADLNADDLPKTRFRIVHVLRGGEHLPESAAEKRQVIEVLYFGNKPKGTPFLLMGSDPPKMNWGTPIPLTDRSVAYLKKIPGLPEKGPKRLAFFLKYLEDEEELLARDAYDEFAKAPYSEMRDLKDALDRKWLLERIQDPQLPTSRRRLYLCMLGLVGKQEDTAVLKQMLTAETDEPRTGLDSLIACYLTLRGPDGLPLIEELYLANKDAEYTDTYAAIMALRFQGQEEKIIPKQRLLKALRLMLERPELADLVIPDLARWEDWSAMDKLVELFKNSDEKTSWVRVPVIQYLRACPKPRAEKLIDELAKIDPDSVRRASFFLPLGGRPSQGTSPAPAPAPDEDDDVDAPAAAPPAKAPAPAKQGLQPDSKKQTRSEAPRSSTQAVTLSCMAGGFALLFFGLRAAARSRAA